eukprot:364869-Chlamydomonas_euryale.AAC.10
MCSVQCLGRDASSPILGRGEEPGDSDVVSFAASNPLQCFECDDAFDDGGKGGVGGGRAFRIPGRVAVCMGWVSSGRGGGGKEGKQRGVCHLPLPDSTRLLSAGCSKCSIATQRLVLPASPARCRRPERPAQHPHSRRQTNQQPNKPPNQQNERMFNNQQTNKDTDKQKTKKLTNLPTNKQTSKQANKD